MFSSVAIIQPHLLHTSIKNYYYNDHGYCYFVDSCSLKFSLDPKDLLIKTFTMHEGKNEQEIHLLTRW